MELRNKWLQIATLWPTHCDCIIYKLTEKNKNKINDIKENFKKLLMEENIQI